MNFKNSPTLQLIFKNYGIILPYKLDTLDYRILVTF